MMRMIWMMFFALLLSACTSIAPPSTPTSTSWQNREHALNQIQTWQINGKIAVQTAQDAGSATVDWTQNHDQYTLSLMGPLGSGGLKLTGKPGQVNLDTADGKHISAPTAEQLLAQTWGWHLPVSNLNYWIRGLPAPSAPANTHFDQYNRLTDLAQQGWNVQFLGYTRVNGIELPNKIAINSATLKSKIIIHQWKI